MGDKSLVRQWLELAEGDFSSAKHLLSLYPHPLEVISYLCEQAAEKMLKAFLEARGVSIPRTHDLSILRQLCSEQDDTFEQLAEMCARLTPYSVHVRYPSSIEITEEDMRLALRDAERVIDFIEPIINLEQQMDAGPTMGGMTMQ